MVITNVNQVVYQGDGVTTAFPFTFRIIDATDIKLLLLDSDGTETDILSDYFVDTENDTVHYPGYAPGAEPALSDRPPVLAEGQKLVIYRKLPITQEKDLGDKWPFYVIELGLDKLTMILQDIWDWLGRCLCVSKGQAYEAGDDFDPTIPLEAGKVICGNANGTGFDAREALMEVNGAWDGEGRQIKGVAEPTDTQDVVTKNYADTRMDNNFMKLQPDGTAWEGRNLPIGNVAGPALVKDAANKDYVDRILAGYSGQGDRFVFFDNVAQMQAAELVPSQMAVTLGYYDVNDGGAGVYTIRDKGADTPDGGSIIAITGTDYVAELITDGTVNVEQYGAYGDGLPHVVGGVDIEAAAIQEALVKFDHVVLNKEYEISTPIVIDKTVIFDLFGTLTYTGNDSAIKVQNTCYCKMFINKLVADDGTGLKLLADTAQCYNNRFDIVSISAKVCIEQYAINSQGVQYNSYYVQWLRATDKCVYCHVDNNTSWTGETQIYGGRLTGKNAHGIYAEYSSAIRVYGTGFEELAHVLYLKDSGETTFYGCRDEDADYGGYAYKLVGGINHCVIQGDVYYRNKIDTSELTSVVGIVGFIGAIYTGMGTVAGLRLLISTDLTVYCDGGNTAPDANAQRDCYIQKQGSGTIGSVEDSGYDFLSPKVIHLKNITGDIVIGDQYKLNCIDHFILQVEGSGVVIKDTDGTTLLTTTDDYSVYNVTAWGLNFRTQAQGKNALYFDKIYSA